MIDPLVYGPGVRSVHCRELIHVYILVNIGPDVHVHIAEMYIGYRYDYYNIFSVIYSLTTGPDVQLIRMLQ